MSKAPCAPPFSDVVVGDITIRYRAGFEARLEGGYSEDRDSRFLKILYCGDQFIGFYHASVEELKMAAPEFSANHRELERILHGAPCPRCWYRLPKGVLECTNCAANNRTVQFTC